MKSLWLNRVPIATWAGILAGIVLALVATGYLFARQPSPVGAVLPSTATMPTTPSPSPEPSTSKPPAVKLTPLPAPTRPAPATSKLIKAYKVAREGLLTNEYAYYNPRNAASVLSSDWNMTSGSLFGRQGAFWTGKPDSCAPNAKSTNCNHSNVFRLDSKQKYSGNIRVSLALMQLGNLRAGGCESSGTCWHGTHVWLRYQNQYNLYYASVNRADGQVVIKRKVPCGADNSGHYFKLGSYVPHDFRQNTWNNYDITIQTNPDHSVTIKLYDAAISTTKPVVTGTDRGGINPSWSPGCKTPGRYASSRYTPITASGGIGIRGDYAEFVFRDLSVSRL